MQGNKSAFKGNFDQLEAAGLVAGVDQTAAQKSKVEARIVALASLSEKIGRVERAVQDIYAMPKPDQLKRLSKVAAAVKKLHASKLPVSTKAPIEACLNELISLKETVYTSNSKVDKKTLALVAAAKARESIQQLETQARARLDKIMAESSQSQDLDEFYRKAAEIIERHSGEAAKLDGIKSKPYFIARAPIVPTGSAVGTGKPTPVSIDRLTKSGFKVENLSGYAVIHNQLVVGINPKMMLGDGVSGMKGETFSRKLREQAETLRKALSKRLKVNLQFVTDKAFSYSSGTWFWLMPERELDAFAKACPGGHVKFHRWGFAFPGKDIAKEAEE